MRVGSLDAPKIATELGARSGASGCAVIVGAIAAEPGAGASKSEMRFGATLSAEKILLNGIESCDLGCAAARMQRHCRTLSA